MRFIQWLCKDIRQLIIRVNTINFNIPFAHMISKKMTSDINMRSSRTLNWIVGNLDGTFIVT
jgi:hypothetical protein